MNDQRTVDLYQKHIETIFGIKKIDDFSNEEVEDAFSVLLEILPNDGKLYKYRSFEIDKFENYYDALENGYLWFPQAESLNDDFDTVLRFDPLTEAENIRDYLLGNPQLYFKAIMTYSSDPINIGYDERDHEAFREVVDCYDINTGKLNKSKARKLLAKKGISTTKSIEYLNQVDTFVENFILNNRDALEKVVENFVNINLAIRRDSYIYSMSETYESNPFGQYHVLFEFGECFHQFEYLV